MKKKGLFIGLGILIFVLIILIVLFCTMFAKLNKEKESITAEDFKVKMQEKGYEIYDATSQFANYSYVKKVYIAVSNDQTYKIEFYEMSDDENAISFYNNNKSIFESYKGNTVSEGSTNLKNYSKYNLTSNGKYYVISRINNTAAYVNSDSNYKDNINSVLNDLGY